MTPGTVLFLDGDKSQVRRFLGTTIQGDATIEYVTGFNASRTDTIRKDIFEGMYTTFPTNVYGADVQPINLGDVILSTLTGRNLGECVGFDYESGYILCAGFGSAMPKNVKAFRVDEVAEALIDDAMRLWDLSRSSLEDRAVIAAVVEAARKLV